MYTIGVTVQGTAPLMQHRYPMPDFDDLVKGGTKHTGAKDYTQEWREYFYSEKGMIVQPAVHFEASMVKAAVNFKITGKRGKTYKDLFRAAVFVTPENIPHNGFKVPDELDTDPDKDLYLDMRPVVVSRSRVVRIRPTFKTGWTLSFTIEVIDDSISSELVNDILSLAGKTVGIGDFRPKFGRFMITQFDV